MEGIMNFKKITILFDMHGCPNRCKHCWIEASPNTKMDLQQIRSIAKEFKKYTNNLEVNTWNREPDYPDNYKELWALDNELSHNETPQRFELCSFYRLYRDPNYIDWLKEFDVKVYQLTLFGLETNTDHYIGRKGAFNEIVNATNILLDNGLIPRWQYFVYKDTLADLDEVIALSKELRLEERSKANGGEFKFFIHEGTCDGEAFKIGGNIMQIKKQDNGTELMFL